MRLYVVRHGESVNNSKKIWTGWADAELTDKGIEDAKKAGAVLSGVKFDKIYSSDLIRAVQTAQTAIPGCEPERTALLREINVGSLAGQPSDSVTAEQRKVFAAEGYASIGGETRAEFLARKDEFLREVVSLDCENVAAFCHGGWMRIMLDTAMGIFVPRDRVLCNNCTVGVFEYKDGKWSIHSWINV